MEDWRRVQGKFSQKEYKHIEKFMKTHQIKNENQLIRRVIEDVVGISSTDKKRSTQSLPKEFFAVNNFFEKYHKKLPHKSEEQLRFKEFFEEWKSQFFIRLSRKNSKRSQRADKTWDDFRKHEKVGRKKAPKQSPGRKKSKGYRED